MNPRTDFARHEPLPTEPVRTRAFPREIPGRAVRLALAVWWIFAPAILGYTGTFPGRQSIVVGVVLLPILALGLFVPQLGWFLFAAGLWMIGSAFASGQYFGVEHAWWHDVITGLLAVVLGAVPFWLLAERRSKEPIVKVEREPQSHFHKPRAGLFRAKRRMSLTGPVVERVHVSPSDPRTTPTGTREPDAVLGVREPDTRAVREADTTLGRELPIGPRPTPTDLHSEP